MRLTSNNLMIFLLLKMFIFHEEKPFMLFMLWRLVNILTAGISSVLETKDLFCVTNGFQ